MLINSTKSVILKRGKGCLYAHKQKESPVFEGLTLNYVITGETFQEVF